MREAAEERGSNDNDCATSASGRGIWLGDFEHDEADDLASLVSEDEDDDARDQAQTHPQKRKGPLDLLNEQRYASSEDDDDDSEDDGEVEEVEKKAREIDKGFFAALDMGDEDHSDSDE